MTLHTAYLYLLSPLHTGGSSQEGNLLGIARETHTDLPYLPASTIRGRLRADTKEPKTQKFLWGNTIQDVTGGQDSNLTQGAIWVGDGLLLWFPVASLSHGVVWVTSPMLVKRWLRFSGQNLSLPTVGKFSGGNTKSLFLKDAIFQKGTSDLIEWNKQEWARYIPEGSSETEIISNVLVLSDEDCRVLIDMSLWRQVRVNLDDKKNADAFRFEEAIPPETIMYFPWGFNTALSDSDKDNACQEFQKLMNGRGNETDDEVNLIKQIGGQESLGRGLVEIWLSGNKKLDAIKS
jgi:CRISPR-associated protein Cmr4